jgi:two-component system response regulator NreC
VTTAAISVLIADDHAVVRSGLRLLLESEDDLAVIGEAGDVGAAVAAVREHRPSVVVLDLTMPGGSSLASIPTMREASPETQIVVLTMQSDPAFARAALQAGALAYVLKEAAGDELVEAIRAAAAGRTYLSPQLGARVAADGGPSRSGHDLTERELQILRMIALGHTNAEIAERLSLSVRTVESHRAHIQQKLGRSTRAELVRVALDRGLLASSD